MFSCTRDQCSTDSATASGHKLSEGVLQISHLQESGLQTCLQSSPRHIHKTGSMYAVNEDQDILYKLYSLANVPLPKIKTIFSDTVRLEFLDDSPLTRQQTGDNWSESGIR